MLRCFLDPEAAAAAEAAAKEANTKEVAVASTESMFGSVKN